MVCVCVCHVIISLIVSSFWYRDHMLFIRYITAGSSYNLEDDVIASLCTAQRPAYARKFITKVNVTFN